MITEKELTKIISQNTASDFFFWLKEHPEVTNIQGYSIRRHDNNAPISFEFGTLRHYMDVEYLYSERNMINDWIDRYLKENKETL